MSDPSIELIDLTTTGLLTDLASLDAAETDEERAAYAKAALAAVDFLLRAGGGSLGIERLKAVRTALQAEFGTSETK